MNFFFLEIIRVCIHWKVIKREIDFEHYGSLPFFQLLTAPAYGALLLLHFCRSLLTNWDRPRSSISSFCWFVVRPELVIPREDFQDANEKAATLKYQKGLSKISVVVIPCNTWTWMTASEFFIVNINIFFTSCSLYELHNIYSKLIKNFV